MTNEISAKERIRNFLNSDSGYATVTRIVLGVLAVGGVLMVAAMAPNIFQIFGKFKKSRHFSDKQIKNSLYALERRNFVRILKEKDDKITIELTTKGQKRIKEFPIDILEIPRPKKWDGKWRILIFDVPNKFTKAREALRNKIKELDFYKLQKSAWVFPYPCEDEILFLTHAFGIESFVEILTVDSLLREKRLKTYFKLT